MTNHQEPRVLIIDDSPVDRLMLSQVLQKEGFTVFTAVDGADGLAKARQEPVDVILLDVMMPDESGFETCSKLKRDMRTNSTPVIFLSASDDTQSRIAGLTGGGVDYIIKPFERKEVLARIRIHIRIRRAFQALIEQQQAQLRQLQNAQQAILVKPEDVPEVRFGVDYRPLHEAGGDFYDVIVMGDGIHGIFSADIAGHDLGAAFITSALKALLRQNFNSLYTPVETMTLMNGVLHPMFSDGAVLSACCARLNKRTNRLVFVSAGHPPILHLKARREVVPIAAEGDLLGAFEMPQFDSVEVPVAPGDRLFFFSDGLIEAVNGKPVTRSVGLQNLIQTILQFADLPLTEMVRAVSFAISGEEDSALDDILLLGVEV